MIGGRCTEIGRCGVLGKVKEVIAGFFNYQIDQLVISKSLSSSQIARPVII
jgi:hypothetical protein